MDVPETIHGCV